MKTGKVLKELLASIRIYPKKGCNCIPLMKKMDQWGPEGCREHFCEIVTQLEQDSIQYNWLAKTQAAGMAALTGLAFKIDIFNPYDSLVEEAIRRSEMLLAEV